MDYSNSIFISQSEAGKDSDISGKVTYTSIFESIPENKLEKPLANWNKKYKTEWRWRFLRINFAQMKDRYVVEISYIKYNSNKRIYFNRYGEWVERVIDPIYDKFVEQEYFVYAND